MGRIGWNENAVFKLKFRESKIDYWAGRYCYDGESAFDDDIVPVARRRGYFTRDEFVELCKWKTPRTQPLVRKNPPDIIEAVTRAALASRHEHVKIGVLRA